MLKRLGCVLLVLMMLLGSLLPALAETVLLDEMPQEAEEAEPTARDDLINRIIALGEHLFEKAGGHPQRAHYKNDIYVCKNFTTYLFNQNKGDFRMAAYPDVKLVIPNNLPA